MSVPSTGSTLCRRLWISRFPHDLFQSQHGRSVSMATKQTQRLSTPTATYQSPPSFLTPTTPSPTVMSPLVNTKTTALPKKLINKALVRQLKADNVEDIRRVLDDLYRSGHIPCISTYNHIMKALAKRFHERQWQLEAHALLADMDRHGVTPSSQTYIQMLLGYIIHTNSAAIDTQRLIPTLFDRLLHCERHQGFKRTHHKIKKLVEVMAGVGHASILPVMEASVKVGICLEPAIWNTALTGCIKRGNVDASGQLLDLMRQQQSSKAPDPTSYHIVIGGYLGQRGNGVVDLDRAIQVLQYMVQDGLTADYRIYQDFLYAYLTPDRQPLGNNLTTVQRLWQAMRMGMTTGQKMDGRLLVMVLDYYMQHHGYSAMEHVYWDLRQHNHALSRRTVIYFYKAVIGFAQKQHLLSGISMFYDLVANGHGANHAATSALLRACILRGQLDMAQQILDVVEESSEQVASDSHYATMVQAYVQQGQLESASRLFEKVCQLSRSPRTLLTAYQAMIHGYFRAQNPDMAESLLDRYLRSSQDASGSSNGKMDQRLVGTMVEGLGLLGGGGDKLDGFLDRQDVEITTVGTMATVIQSRLYHGDCLGAERDLKQGLDQFGVVALQSSIQGVLSGMALNGSVSSCESLANLLSTNGLMDAGAYAALLVCYGRSGDATKLKHVYDELLQKGLPLEQGLANKHKRPLLVTMLPLPSILDHAHRFTNRHIHFLQIHYFYILLIILVFSGLFYCPSGTSWAYIDALYMATTSCTNTGVNTIPLSNMSTYQVMVLYFSSLAGSHILVSLVVVMVRKYYFNKRFREVVLFNKARKARELQRRRQNSITSNNSKLNNRPVINVLLHSGSNIGDQDMEPGIIGPLTMPLEHQHQHHLRQLRPQQQQQQDTTIVIDEPNDGELQQQQHSSDEKQQQESHFTDARTTIGGANIIFADNIVQQREAARQRLEAQRKLEDGKQDPWPTDTHQPQQQQQQQQQPSDDNDTTDILSLAQDQMELTREQRYYVGGAEYRALDLLTIVIPSYYVGTVLCASLAFRLYIAVSPYAQHVLLSVCDEQPGAQPDRCFHGAFPKLALPSFGVRLPGAGGQYCVPHLFAVLPLVAVPPDSEILLDAS
ncbi:hypothetical protein [Absidia glauca]|uniref:Pentacotripeptide-repeat region of PRORP domain-containing protein n=1 Tax=Absidia glauca TaxID=4829 RepID=A0A168T7Y2_ABSGL|nr:hypothetical protein [Absidia glauca]